MTTGLDPAKLREAVREDIAALAVAHGVIDDLTTIIDERWSEIYRTRDRLKMIFGHLGVDLADFRFDSTMDGDILLAKLAELEAAAKEGGADQ